VAAGLLLAALLCARLLFLLAALDPEEDRIVTILEAAGAKWERGPERPIYDREELYTGAAAEAMRLGLPIPARAYQFMPYGSGSLLISQAARGVFALFGPTYLAFKLLPLLVTLLAGGCWYGIARLWLGARTALIFAALFLLAPSVVVRTALIAKGDHAEAMAWNGLALLLASGACFAPRAARRDILAALAGSVAGLGVGITYSTVPVVAGAALAAAARTRLRPRRAWLAAAAGLAVGLAPWLLRILREGASTVRLYEQPVGALLGLGEWGSRIALLARTGFLAGYDLPGDWRTIAGLIWLAAVVAGWTGLVRRRERRTFVLLLSAAAAAHLAAFVLAAPDASARYLLPAYPLLLLAAAALGGARLPEPPAGPPRIGRPAAWLLLGVGAAGLLAQVLVVARSDFVALRAPLRGYDWPLLGEVLGAKLHPEGLRRLPEPTQPYFWTGRGRRIGRAGPDAWMAEAATAAPHAEAFWEGIGIALMESGRVEQAAPVLPLLPEAERTALRRGMWRYGENVFAPLLRRGPAGAAAAVVARFDPADRAEARVALARTAAVLRTQGVALAPGAQQAARAALERADVEEAEGWARCRRARPDGLRWWAPPLDTAAFWRGVASAWGAHLQVRTPESRLGTPGGPVELQRESERLAGRAPAESAGAFYRAAGAACRSAWLDPSRNPRVPPDREAWLRGILAPAAAEFRAGLDGTSGVRPASPGS